MTAFEWFLIGMATHMLLQGGRLGEFFVANLTLERSVPSMSLEMPAYFLLAGKASFPMPVASLPPTVVVALAATHMRRRQMLRQLVASREVQAARLPKAPMDLDRTIMPTTNFCIRISSRFDGAVAVEWRGRGRGSRIFFRRLFLRGSVEYMTVVVPQGLFLMGAFEGAQWMAGPNAKVVVQKMRFERFEERLGRTLRRGTRQTAQRRVDMAITPQTKRVDGC